MVSEEIISDEHIRIYKDALKIAYSDGSLGDDGGLMLMGLQKRYHINQDLHEQLLLDVFIYLAEWSKEEGDLQEALKWFKVLVEMDNYDEHAWKQMGEIHTTLGEYSMAGKCLIKARKISKKSEVDDVFSTRVENKKELYKNMWKERKGAMQERREHKRRRRRQKKEVMEEVEFVEIPAPIDMEDTFEIIEEKPKKRRKKNKGKKLKKSRKNR